MMTNVLDGFSKSCNDVAMYWMGRWSRERYDGAVAALVHILRAMSATSSDRCVLRPALREEARKAVGEHFPEPSHKFKFHACS